MVTSVWSHVLRRRRQDQVLRRELEELIREGRVVVLGPIRQELLSGIKSASEYERLRAGLEPFPDISIGQRDYESAASCFNQCRAKGIQGSNTDFLICAVALRGDFRIFTTDKDFELYRRVLKIGLYKAREWKSE